MIVFIIYYPKAKECQLEKRWVTTDNVDIFHNEYEKYSKVEIFLEYCDFLQSLPDLITCEKKKIVDIVRS